ncbi:hypothetical protein GQ600_21881 [Phytophthora cactorum]|nr:hypothetical protein GQ600_21881 [Phytophthora cactorum]
MDRQDAGEFGQAYARGDNIASTPFESQKALQQRYREKDAKESNAKYISKKMKDQQQLVPGSLERCPFYITVYGL